MIRSISAHPRAALSCSKSCIKAGCSDSGARYCQGEQIDSIWVSILPSMFVAFTSCTSIPFILLIHTSLPFHIVTLKGFYQISSFKIVSWQPTGSHKHLELPPPNLFNLPFNSNFSYCFSRVLPAKKKQLTMLLTRASTCNP